MSFIGSEREDSPLRATKSCQRSRKLRSWRRREGHRASLGDPKKKQEQRPMGPPMTKGLSTQSFQPNRISKSFLV